MGLFRGAVFRHGGGARKQPIKQPTEMPTSSTALLGRFPLVIMGRFPTLMGRFTDFVLRGPFASWKSQGRILAVWILAAKLPNSDLNFAVDFWVDFFPACFPKEKSGFSKPRFWGT